MYICTGTMMDYRSTTCIYMYTAAEVPPCGKWAVLYTEKFVCLDVQCLVTLSIIIFVYFHR